MSSLYLPRIVDQELDALLDVLPAVLIEGPKGVGKTATARERAASVVYMDDIAQRAIAQADPRAVLHRQRPILIDEWQHVPAVWDAVRRAVDDNNEPNQYILTGSATPRVHPTHSGAGRIVTLRMRPMSLVERGIEKPTIRLEDILTGSKPELRGHTEVTLADYTREIINSGFPGIRHLSGRALRSQLDSYLARIVDRDFDEQGHPAREPETLKRWMRAYAAVVASTAPMETIRDAATGGEGNKPSRAVANKYREVLEQLWIAEPLPAWTPSESYFTDLVHAPKQHLADPALSARLLGVTEEALLSGTSVSRSLSGPYLRDGSLLGRLFESLVTLSVRVYAQAAEASVKHLRTKGGRQEIDLIVVRGDQRVVAIEVKMGVAVDDDDVRHLLWLKDRIGDELLDAIVINSGPQAYRRPDGIGVVPAALLGS